MPYITKDRVKEIRNQIKKEFPDFKFSIVNRHHTQVSVTILAGPIDMLAGSERNERGYEQVNYFHIKQNYSERPEVCKVLSRIYEIMNDGNRTVSTDGDYGDIPAFYVSMSIGDYDKPFQIINK